MTQKTFWRVLFIALVWLAGSSLASAQTLTTFYNFDDPGLVGDGFQPLAALVIGPDGDFYGTTTFGGTGSEGCVFKITPAGVETILHNFGDGSVVNDGDYPSGLVLGRDGNFYGTTSAGGATVNTSQNNFGYGTIFKITPAGAEAVLYSFPSSVSIPSSTLHPLAALVQGSDGNFYGTTGAGGTTGMGSVFKITPSGVFSLLHSFGDGSVTSDGEAPEAALTPGTDGNFYGQTTTGGASGFGTIFRITSAGVETTLYNFPALVFSSPYYRAILSASLVLGSDGAFYGTTPAGGSAGDGMVYKITPTGTFTTIHNFGDPRLPSIPNDGANPNTLIEGSDGNFYGTTTYGGVLGTGTIFKITPPGTETILHNSGDLRVAWDGLNSESALVQGSDGNFYGMTCAGGNGDYIGPGTVFKITSAGHETVLHRFGVRPEISTGSSPGAPLIQGGDGSFYSTTSYGGASLGGTVFKITTTGIETPIYNFGTQTDRYDGWSPNGLVLGTDGNFYGTTFLGGDKGTGMVFKVTPSGTETALYSFGDGNSNDGANPEASLIQASDGNFYGTTAAGGSENGGTVFKITPTGAETIIHSFGTGGADEGVVPDAALVQGSDGNLYGTTQGGGIVGDGTIFKITLAGVETVLYNFHGGTGPVDGSHPAAALIQGRDGNFYGTASGDFSAFDEGSVFKITPSGAFTSLCSTTGQLPLASLVQGNDGNFYGTTASGGPVDQGTLYEVTPTGTETVLHNFGDGTVRNDGSDSYAGLIQGRDGSLYGTTSGGGTAYEGTVFMLSLPSAKAWASTGVAAAPDGTARILWTRSDGAAGLWSINANDAQTRIGPAYGPYTDSDGTWTANAVKVDSDATARLLWTRSDGAMSVWSLDASGQQIAAGPTYGPYTGWTAVAIAVAPDGTSRVLWTQKDGVAGVWTLNANDAETKIGPTYGPNTNWTAIAVGAAADGTARVLWSNESGAAGIWTINADDALQTVGPTYGPYYDSLGGWSAAGLGTSADGQSQVLWNRIDGAAGVWTFNASDFAVSAGPVYGPYPGFTAAGADAADDQARVLWVRADRAAGLWSFGSNDVASLIGGLYGPY